MLEASILISNSTTNEERLRMDQKSSGTFLAISELRTAL